MSVRDRNTAVFFDLENLLDGYGQGLAGRIERLSVPRIMERIGDVGRAQDVIGRFAVKRAYADWSKSQLSVLRRVLTEQGIEPRQIFAFGDAGKTNAADIELVIDVLEFAYTQPEITTFVVVSGDGGFGTLVRKLHEFGKTVIVGAYQAKASRGLRAVADEFVELDRGEPDQVADVIHTSMNVLGGSAASGPEAPATKADSRIRLRTDGPAPSSKLTEYVLRKLLASPEVRLDSVDAMPSAVLALTEQLAKDGHIGTLITRGALPMPDFAPGVAVHLDRGIVEATFGSWGRLLRVAYSGTDFCLVFDRARRGAVFVGRRSSPPRGYDVLEDVEMPDEIEQLRGKLRTARVGIPEDPSDLWSVADVLARAPAKDQENGTDLMERLLESDDLDVMEVAAVRHSLSVLSRAGMLQADGDGAIGESSFRQRHTDLERTIADTRALVRRIAGRKVEDSTIDQLLGLQGRRPA